MGQAGQLETGRAGKVSPFFFAGRAGLTHFWRAKSRPGRPILTTLGWGVEAAYILVCGLVLAVALIVLDTII